MLNSHKINRVNYNNYSIKNQRNLESVSSDNSFLVEFVKKIQLSTYKSL